MSGEEEDISESEDEQVVKVLPKRGTRGRRFNQLIGEEKKRTKRFGGRKPGGMMKTKITSMRSKRIL